MCPYCETDATSCAIADQKTQYLVAKRQQGEIPVRSSVFKIFDMILILWNY